MDSDGQTTLDQNMPGAVEVGNVEVWVLGRCDNPSVCMQISATAFPRRKRKVGYLNDIDTEVFMLLSLSPTPPPTGDFSKCKQQMRNLKLTGIKVWEMIREAQLLNELTLLDTHSEVVKIWVMERRPFTFTKAGFPEVEETNVYSEKQQ